MNFFEASEKMEKSEIEKGGVECTDNTQSNNLDTVNDMLKNLINEKEKKEPEKEEPEKEEPEKEEPEKEEPNIKDLLKEAIREILNEKVEESTESEE